MKYYLEGNYYFDIDVHNQLRIAGPQNHLLLGLSFPQEVTLDIVSSKVQDDQLQIKIATNVSSLSLSYPLVTDIRTLRNYTEPVSPTPSYDALVSQGVNELLPREIKPFSTINRTGFSFINTYRDENGNEKTYGARLSVDSSASIALTDEGLLLESQNSLTLWLETVSTVTIEDPLHAPVFEISTLNHHLFSPAVNELYDKAQREVEYLVRNKKTSSFEYGTIFPRDWIESADLGVGDLNQAAVDYMYRQSMRYISESGEGWHEDIVGEYKTKIPDRTLHIDRKMIDIEPKYILGLRVISSSLLMDDTVHSQLKLVAHYLLTNATNRNLITFKNLGADPNEYHFIGNWRDSYHAYPRQKAPLAPYDVNCVFYPQSLRVIREHVDYFDVDSHTIDELINKWDRQKNKYRLYHDEQLIGYSLALHGRKRLPLPISHLDESYDLFYGQPSLEEVTSFAVKVMDEEFFFTPVGPLLVCADEEDFTTRHYHGKVIWPKQAAFTVAGLTQQFFRGIQEHWPEPVLSKIKEAVFITAEACFKGWEDLGAVPELYYYDPVQNQARFYTDQSDYEAQMSLVQLWSAIGARRIIRDYARLKEFNQSQP